MKYIQLGKSGLTVPSVALGCMRIRDVSAKEAEELVSTALELGCNFSNTPTSTVRAPARKRLQTRSTCPHLSATRSFYSPNAALFPALCMIFPKNTFYLL